MCGIIGIVKNKESGIDKPKVKKIISTLLKLSVSRGNDSSGIAVVIKDTIYVYKESISANMLVKSLLYNDLLDGIEDDVAIIGHARMETNGSFALSYNNQPVVKNGCFTVHNGIIVNDNLLWNNKDLTKEFEVDSEIINSLIRSNLSKGHPLIKAVKESLNLLKGSFAIGMLFDDLNYLLLATNTGSIYMIKGKGVFMFVSERYFAENLLKKQFSGESGHFKIIKLEPLNAVLINLSTLEETHFSLSKDEKEPPIKENHAERDIKIIGKQLTAISIDPVIKSNIERENDTRKMIEDEYLLNLDKINNLRRCTKCLLPETMPFITFDQDGVCNYCFNYQKIRVNGKESLEKKIAAYELNTGKPNCIVSFSGGRDSSFALHYVKKELGLNPLAYSYDWGMLTDIGRRNQARMTGQLGVEHILISANIQKKREFIRKNVSAWLKKPNIGTVPLFMAGDKQYFYYLNKLRKETGIDLIIYADNALEKTDFKYGFANVKLTSEVGKAYKIGRFNSLRLIWFYAIQYLSNPAYINASLFDTLAAYFSSYIVPKDYVYLYRDILWEEKEIERTLIELYEWETSADTQSTWRIGDGTASFYNYIYYMLAGFTENDTFRSNQIREGLITREEGLKMTAIENKPRFDSIQWYCNTIRLDMDATINIINKIPKLYH